MFGTDAQFWINVLYVCNIALIVGMFLNQKLAWRFYGYLGAANTAPFIFMEAHNHEWLAFIGVWMIMVYASHGGDSRVFKE